MWAIEHGLNLGMLSFISNVCLKYAPKWMVSSSIFQKFSGEGLTEPPPQPPPNNELSGIRKVILACGARFVLVSFYIIYNLKKTKKQAHTIRTSLIGSHLSCKYMSYWVGFGSSVGFAPLWIVRNSKGCGWIAGYYVIITFVHFLV